MTTTTLILRIAGFRLGDRIEFYGEYEWNNEGGVIHWTHHDPDELNIDGRILHNNNIYQ